MAPVDKPSVCFLKQTEFAVDVCDVSAEEEEEDVISVLRDRSHIDETLRLAMEEKAGDYAGEDWRWKRHVTNLQIFFHLISL